MSPDFLIPEDAFRKLWADNSGDWAFQVLKFLQGRRLNEITAAEIVRTQTYARCNEAEQAVLVWVAEQAENVRSLSVEDGRRLRERDSFLMAYVEGASLGHRDWVLEIQSIPNAVAHAQAVDASLFPVTYQSKRLFSWIWEAR